VDRLFARRRRLIPACAAVLLGCASGAARAPGTDYLRYVAVEVPINEHVVIRWQTRQMPLRVHLPSPPEGLFPEPEVIQSSVRDGVTDWTDVAAPGVPSFVFVDDARDADIDVVWAEQASGDWFVAFCAPHVDVMQRKLLAPAHILVTGRYKDGRIADLHDVHAVVLHEMGHALGLLGHSPDRADLMYPRMPETAGATITARDRETLRKLYEKPVGTQVSGTREFER
jgi:predicted Zn-dependent protease